LVPSQEKVGGICLFGRFRDERNEQADVSCICNATLISERCFEEEKKERPLVLDMVVRGDGSCCEESSRSTGPLCITVNSQAVPAEGHDRCCYVATSHLIYATFAITRCSRCSAAKLVLLNCQLSNIPHRYTTDLLTCLLPDLSRHVCLHRPFKNIQFSNVIMDHSYSHKMMSVTKYQFTRAGCHNPRLTNNRAY
jgi:hypothetical protein